MVWFDQVIDEYSTDVAQGGGDAMNAVAVMFGIAPEHREHFGERHARQLRHAVPEPAT